MLLPLSWRSYAADVSYTYDPLNRLVQVQISTEETSKAILDYAYDEVGNRTADTVTVDKAPNSPGNPSPADGKSSVELSPALSWSGGDPDADDTVSYDVFFGTASPPATKVSSAQSETSYSPSGLTTATTYYWQVTATDRHGLQTQGPVWSFTTTNDPTAAFSPAPASGWELVLNRASSLVQQGN
jgi:hypothetical protein